MVNKNRKKDGEQKQKEMKGNYTLTCPTSYIEQYTHKSKTYIHNIYMNVLLGSYALVVAVVGTLMQHL